tara:strand:+ start:540 stop:1199 length:660 start_codon:yes stop_codon:yes gene_type:complete
MSYFRELPNISYVSLLPNQNRSDERIEVKNLFKRAKLRTDVDQSVTSFDYYLVQDNERPDIIAQKIYEDPNLDWVILVTNNITSIRNQWPLSNNELYQYCLEKYGSDLAVMQTKHFETQEVKDNFGRILLKKGLIVDENFKFTYSKDDNTIETVNPAKSVSRYTYEQRINEDKRKIRVLKPGLLSAFITDFRNIMKYDRSSSFINKSLISSYNPREFGV